MIAREKLKQAVRLLDDLNIDCWLTFVRESEVSTDPMLAYVCGSDVTWHTAFLVFRTGQVVVVAGEGNRQTLEDQHLYHDVIGYVTDFSEPFLRVLQAYAPQTIAANYSEASDVCDGLTHGMFLTLQRLLGRIGWADRLVSSEALVGSLRGRKSPAEIAAMRLAIALALEIVDTVTPLIRPGTTEREIAAAMPAGVRARGLGFAWSADLCPAVFTGPEALGSHALPTDRVIEPGHLVYIDFGVSVGGYCSDLQRTFYVPVGRDREVPDDVRRGVGTLVAAIEHARAALRPGVAGVDVDRAARTYLVEQGYGEYQHGLGHQIGRFAHDGFALLGPAWAKYGRKVLAPVEAGMVFTIEPRLFVPGHGHVSIEEMLVVTDDGAEYLSPPQTEIIVVDGGVE